MRQGKIFGALVVSMVALAGPVASASAQTQFFVLSQTGLSGGFGGVLGVNATTGARTLLSDNATPNNAAPLFNAPNGIALDLNGNLVVANGTDNNLLRVNAVTGARTLISSNAAPAGSPTFNQPAAVAVDGATGQIYVGNAGAPDRVIRVDPATGARSDATGTADLLEDPFGIIADGNGHIYVTNVSGPYLPVMGGRPAVVRIDLATNTSVGVSDNSSAGCSWSSPDDVTLDPSGQLIVANAGADELVRVNPATGACTVLSSNTVPNASAPLFGYANGLALDATGNLAVADFNCCTGAFGGVIRVNSTTGVRTLLSDNNNPMAAPNFANPVDIADAPFVPAVPETPATTPTPPSSGPTGERDAALKKCKKKKSKKARKKCRKKAQKLPA